MNNFFKILLFYCIIVIFISGCGQSHEIYSPRSGTGSVDFNLIWPEDVPRSRSSKAPSIDCTGIEAINVDVYDDTTHDPVAGASFYDCSKGEGTVDGIPVGKIRRIEVSVMGPNDDLRFFGSSEVDIPILRGESVNVGHIIMESQNELPVASIRQPSGGTFNEGDEVTFDGSGTDSEDGQLTGDQLEWKSSRDGVIGTGTTFDIDNLSPGIHTITLTVTDDNGGIDTDTIQITIWSTDKTDYIADVSFSDAGGVDVLTWDMNRVLDCNDDGITDVPEPFTDVFAEITVSIADLAPGLTMSGYTIEYLPEPSSDSTGSMVMPPTLSNLTDDETYTLYIPSDSSQSFTIICFYIEQKANYMALAPAGLDTSRYTIRITLHCTDDNGEAVNLEVSRVVYFGNYDNC